jgi:hypothetical protein
MKIIFKCNKIIWDTTFCIIYILVTKHCAHANKWRISHKKKKVLLTEFLNDHYTKSASYTPTYYHPLMFCDQCSLLSVIWTIILKQNKHYPYSKISGQLIFLVCLLKCFWHDCTTKTVHLETKDNAKYKEISSEIANIVTFLKKAGRLYLSIQKSLPNTCVRMINVRIVGSMIAGNFCHSGNTSNTGFTYESALKDDPTLLILYSPYSYVVKSWWLIITRTASHLLFSLGGTTYLSRVNVFTVNAHRVSCNKYFCNSVATFSVSITQVYEEVSTYQTHTDLSICRLTVSPVILYRMWLEHKEL